MAIAGERIIAAGTDEQVRATTGPGTKTIDARGRLVVPGLTDSHIHLISGGLQLSRLDLRDAPDRAEFVRRVAARAGKTPPRQWILGGRWTVDSWDDPAPPRKEWVDPVTGDVPLFLARMDGHQALANSAALKLAGIDAQGPPDPKGGIIERDPETGEPTGILKDDAMTLVTRHIPPPSTAERYDALRAAMAHLNRYGFLMADDWSKHYGTLSEYSRGDAWFRVGGLKGFVDGSLGSRTAFMREPYADAAPDSGYPRGLLVEQADPFEKKDLWETHPEVVKALRLKLQKIKQLDKSDEFPDP